MIDLVEGVLTEFSERQRLAPVHLSVPRYLRVTRPQAPASYWQERRARGVCSCGGRVVSGKSRCATCAAKRTKGTRVLRPRNTGRNT